MGSSLPGKGEAIVLFPPDSVSIVLFSTGGQGSRQPTALSRYSQEESESQVESCPILCDPMDCSLLGSPSMGFSRQEYWSGSPFPSPGDLPNPGVEPRSPASQADAPPGMQARIQPGGESGFLTSPVLTPKAGVITAWVGGGGWRFQLPTCPP